jgi:hypothetical protein
MIENGLVVSSGKKGKEARGMTDIGLQPIYLSRARRKTQ